MTSVSSRASGRRDRLGAGPTVPRTGGVPVHIASTPGYGGRTPALLAGAARGQRRRAVHRSRTAHCRRTRQTAYTGGLRHRRIQHSHLGRVTNARAAPAGRPACHDHRGITMRATGDNTWRPVTRGA